MSTHLSFRGAVPDMVGGREPGIHCDVRCSWIPARALTRATGITGEDAA